MKFPDRESSKIIDLPLTTRIDEASATVTYIGEAEIGTATSVAEWRIKKITVSGTVTSITWPGSDSFKYEWDERANLTWA